jgi:DNA replication and repair protein RecF
LILRLRLHQFRSYSALDIASDARLLVLVGENGAGKTNLLEALSLLVPGRGLRRAQAEDMIRQGKDAYAISADVSVSSGVVRLGVGLERRLAQGAGLGQSAGLERRFRIDGEAAPSHASFAEYLRMLWLTPDQDGLFRGPAGDRRRFLDRLVLAIDPEHGARSSQFERLLRERNRLLSEIMPDPVWLSAIEREAADLAVAIAAARVETVNRLSQLIGDAPSDAVFPHARLRLAGDIEERVGQAPAGDIEHWYRETLRDQRGRDRAAGRTLAGPQASDLIVHHAVKDMPAELSSTGEQKGLLIGLVLAQAQLVADMTGIAPILLLDEAVAHLDERRRIALFEHLSALGGQVWMTGTDAALFAGAPSHNLRLMVGQGGTVEPF